jgi:hypothetical protein
VMITRAFSLECSAFPVLDVCGNEYLDEGGISSFELAIF